MKNKNQLYVQANRDWLVAKSREDGVKALPGGVYYKVLAEGDHSGATPTPSSVITALHGQDHRWGDIRQQPWRRDPGLPIA